MAEKKLIRSVTVFGSDAQTVVDEYEVGEIVKGIGTVVAINHKENGVQIYFRDPEEKETAPKKMEDRPMRFYQNVPFKIEDKFE